MVAIVLMPVTGGAGEIPDLHPGNRKANPTMVEPTMANPMKEEATKTEDK